MKTDKFQFLNHSKPLLIAGPCVLENIDICIETATRLFAACERLGFSYIFKASFDKANRTSLHSFRGPGMEKGLEMLAAVKSAVNCPVISDIHLPQQAEEAARVLDMIQIPAFLCRQTDLLMAAARTGLPVNVKKGQFLAPWDMRHVLNKLRESGCEQVFFTERGSCFGYNNLVVDFRSLAVMRSLGVPVIFDATHSVQLPGAGDGCSSGERQHVAMLARAAVAAGVDGIFMEVHPKPDNALCDGPNSLQLDEAEKLLSTLKNIREAVYG